MKVCCTCKKELPANNEYFGNNKNQKDGLNRQCKNCVKKHKQKYYAENKEKVNRKNMDNYYKKNPKEIIPDGLKKCATCCELKPFENFGKQSKSKDGYKYSCKDCRREKEYLANRDKVMEKSRLWYENNKEYAAIRQKKYVIKNIDKKRANDKRYYQDNKEMMKERAKRYLYNRVQTDVGFKILQRCRKRLWAAVKGHDKSARTRELIGCSNEELLEHLESQFTDGMTWDNYGEWHIDHIMPCASFDFSIPDEQFECFNYKNLQPLWAADNFSKHDKILAP